MNILERLSIEPFSIVGHRGAAGVKPENTLSAIKYALEKNVDIIEVDVRRTKDNKLILLHDPDFKRFTGKALHPRELTYDFIKENIFIDGEPVATLDEAIKTVSSKAGLFIEIKEPDTVDDILSVVIKNNAVNWVALISFYDRAIKEAKDLLPSIKTGLIYLKPPGRILEAKQLNADIVLPYYRLATYKANYFAHKLGLKVVAWTVNDEETASKLVENNIDAIATDYPDVLIRFRENVQAKL